MNLTRLLGLSPFASLPRAAAPMAAAVAAVALAGCAPAVVTAEVLPPRTGVSCATPTTEGPALGRGLLDAHAVDDEHGSYRADLRLVVTGANARVDGVDVVITRDGDEIASLEDVPTGDALLVGEGDDVRKAVVENVELIPRSVTRELRPDTKITAQEFATLVVQITPRVVDDARGAGPAEAASSTFAVDVCNGCLVDEPDEETCPLGAVRQPVCRVGQDAEMWACSSIPLTGGAP